MWKESPSFDSKQPNGSRSTLSLEEESRHGGLTKAHGETYEEFSFLSLQEVPNILP